MQAFNTRRDERNREVESVPHISRAEFLDQWHFSPTHVTFIGPTQRGKTTFAIQLLQRTISPKLPVVALAGKPPDRDPTMAKMADVLNLRIVTTWPPDRTFKDRNRNGFVLRPKHSMKDIDADNDNLSREFRKAIMSCYASKKPVILLVDEAHQVQNDLKLKKECESILMRGMPVVSEWSLIQRGFYVTYHCYSAPEHVFIFNDPDKSNQDRYKEIGGVDPGLVGQLVRNLKTYETEAGNSISECLYIRRSGPRLMIIDVE